jgi:hypothetical protein
MAQHAVLSHPDVANVGTSYVKADTGWSPRFKLVCFLGCAIASWAVILTPLFLAG